MNAGLSLATEYFNSVANPTLVYVKDPNTTSTTKSHLCCFYRKRGQIWTKNSNTLCHINKKRWEVVIWGNDVKLISFTCKGLFVWKEVALRAVADWLTGSRPHSRFLPAAMAMAAEGCCHWLSVSRGWLINKCHHITDGGRWIFALRVKREWKWTSTDKHVPRKDTPADTGNADERYKSPTLSCSPTPHANEKND